jgi:HlyD family secretion protein
MSSIIEESKKSKGRSFFGITKKKIVLTLVAITVLFFSYSFMNKDDEKKVVQKQKEWTVRTDDLKIAIEADGKVVAKDGVELSFSVSGNNLEVEEVFVSEGDDIKKGDKIATVKTETLELNVRTAYAGYQSALASFNKVMDGATDEDAADARDSITSAEINLQQAQISLANTIQNTEKSIYNAEQDLEDAKDDLEDNQNELTSEDVSDAYKSLVDSIKSSNISLDSILKESDEIVGVDDKFLNNDFEDTLGVSNLSTLTNAKASYAKSRNELNILDLVAINLSYGSGYRDIDLAAIKVDSALNEFEKHLYDMKLLLEATVVSSDLTQGELSAFISTISSNRTSVNSLLSVMNSKKEAVKDAKESLENYIETYEEAQIDLANAEADAKRDIENANANVQSRELSLEQAKRNLDELTSPPTETEKASARSSLTSASVNLQKNKNELENATIISPIDGKLARLNYNTGDIIVDPSSADNVATIINNDTLFVEVNIEEADINKISVEQKTYAVFDALDGLSLEGEISFISQKSSTNNSGIVTYLVRVLIEKGDAPVREGMTAFIEFITAETKDVLIVPVTAVKNVKNSPSVQKMDGEWTPVTTGFTDGKNVEVISGLDKGDKIVY